jgi:hypothetical protein
MRAARAVCAAWALTVGGCDRAAAPPTLAPDDTRASLALVTAVHAATATSVDVRAGYLRADGEWVELGARTVRLERQSDQQATLSIDLARCLADPRRAVGGPACEVTLEVRLLRGTTTLDRQTLTTRARPGDALTISSPVELHEIAAIHVAVSGASASVEVADTLRLTATALDVTGAAVAGRVVRWESASPSVVQVDTASGLVTGVAAGRAAVRALAGGRAGEIAVTVSPVSVRSLTASPAALTLEAGETRTVAVTARDAHDNVLVRAVTFASTDVAVASVAADGTVRAAGPGPATVTATSDEGPNGTRVSVRVPVVVRPPTPTRSADGRLYVGRTGAPVSGATLRFVRLGADSAAGAAATAAATVTSAADGTWRATVPEGLYAVSVDAAGMRSTTIHQLPVYGDVTVPAVPMTLDDVTSGAAEVTLRDATTGRRLEIPATLTILEGVALRSEGVDAVIASRPSTRAQVLSVPAGGTATVPSLSSTVTIRARAAGYADAFAYVAPVAGRAVTVSLALVPPGVAGEVRVVLTWGANPADLDAWLAGPTALGGRFAIFWNARGDCAASPFACLDVDDRDGFGPETITIRRQLPGVYRYVVNRYAGDGPLATAGARVDVYVEGQLARTFTPPPGLGDWWTVFEFADGHITPLNTYGGQPMLRAPSASSGVSSSAPPTRKGASTGRYP